MFLLGWRCTNLFFLTWEYTDGADLQLAILQAAASMVVNVGSFSDPKDLEGLAHFLGISIEFLVYSVLCL